jgi:flagellar hook assembly protein FlgD
LHSAYPNPFNPSTLIGYDLPRDSHVSLEIFDLNGRLVKTLINGYFRAGKHQVAWNADQISSGIYLVRLVTGKKVFNQKITYLK